MDETLKQLIDYVNTASDLAEAIEEDLSMGQSYTADTIVKLARFRKAAEAFSSTESMIKLLN